MKRQDRWGHYGEGAQVETALDFNAIRVIIRQFVEVAPQLMQCPVCQADNLASAVTCEKCSTPFPLSDATISPSEYGQSTGWSKAATLRPSIEAAAKGQLDPGSMLADPSEPLQFPCQAGLGPLHKPTAHD